MSNLNHIVMTGNLTKDPRTGTAKNGSPFTEIRITSNRKWNGKNGDGLQEETCFINAVVWGKRAKALADHFKQGSPILIEGYLKLKQWKDEDGNPRSNYEININNFEFMSSKPREEVVAIADGSNGDFDTVDSAGPSW